MRSKSLLCLVISLAAGPLLASDTRSQKALQQAQTASSGSAAPAEREPLVSECRAAQQAQAAASTSLSEGSELLSISVQDLMLQQRAEASGAVVRAEPAAPEAAARGIQAIPLFRARGARILPFPDADGNPIAIGQPLLSFQILPFPDSRGNLVPILRDGPRILPFVDPAGEPVPIGREAPDRQ